MAVRMFVVTLFKMCKASVWRQFHFLLESGLRGTLSKACFGAWLMSIAWKEHASIVN
jgi:hypothetical protein